jgi:hypothetical protein
MQEHDHCSGSANTNEQRFLSELMEPNQHGAVPCLLGFRTLGMNEAAGRFARAGLERLSTAQFQRDVTPLISQPCFFREVSCSLLA